MVLQLRNIVVSARPRVEASRLVALNCLYGFMLLVCILAQPLAARQCQSECYTAPGTQALGMRSSLGYHRI